MISWTKKILITISAISDEKVNTKEKTEDCLIENYKNIGKFGSINNPIAKVGRIKKGTAFFNFSKDENL